MLLLLFLWAAMNCLVVVLVVLLIWGSKFYSDGKQTAQNYFKPTRD
jgi:hypothetical protein